MSETGGAGPALELRGIVRTYHQAGTALEVLRGASLSLRAGEIVALVGPAARESHRPARLSGGEQQRVAIVRALANEPRILLGDEPTGNLDQHTAEGVTTSLINIVRHAGLAALFATHNLDLARRM